MKRLFTFALAALIAVTAVAQSQPAQRRAAHTRMHQAVRVSNGKRTTFGQKLTLNERTLFAAPDMKVFHESRRNSPAKVTEKEGNLTITKDWHGVITDVAGVEPRYYNREGQAFYYSSGSIGLTDQAGMAKLVIDGSNVYWYEPVSMLTDGCWIKGIKEGNTITFAAHQLMEYVTEYDTTISVRWVSVAANGQVSTADDHADSFTFVIDGDVMTFQGSQVWDEGADIYLMGAVWDDDNSFTGFGDAGTILTLDSGYTPPGTDLVDLPDGVIAEGWYCNGIDLGEGCAVKNKAVNVAFTGNDVYVQGLFDEFPSAWIKGTKDGDTYTFDKFQYIGHYDYSMPVWAMGADPVTEELIDATAAYDAVAKTLTFTTDLLANADEGRIYYVNWLAYVVLSADEVEYPEPTLNELTTTLPYFNSFDTEKEMGEVVIYDANEDNRTFMFQYDTKVGEGNIAASCQYNSTQAADDYLVFPAVMLEAGKSYSVSIDARAESSSYPERVSVVCGKESKVSALTTEVVAPTTVSSADVYVNIANNAFTVSESGMYTIAVKACSDKDQYYLWVDNFSVKENVSMLDNNLSARGLSAPAKVNAGNDIVATATVNNMGKLAVAGADYTVKFTVNGKDYSVDGVDLATGASAQFVYTVATNAASAEVFIFKAEVVYAADEDLTDNATSEVSVDVVQTGFPTVSNVVVAEDGSSIVLNWEEPNLENFVPKAVTEDFESYEPFLFGNSIGDWTLMDGDGAAMGGLQDIDVPNLTIGATVGSFFVLNRESISDHYSFDAVSGVQYLSTMFAYQPARLDDWIISPALPGVAQTVSFFAKSYSSDYPESFQVLCSTTDLAVESFFKVSGDSDVVAPEEWTEYTYDLPEGAKWFAIRCTSYDAFMLLIDDVTYIPAPGMAADLEIVGYNVYRNGEKINEQPLAETCYVDASSLASETTYRYGVSVVYTQGESAVVNADIFAGVGVDSVDAASDGAIYYNMQGVRVAKPAAGEAVIRVINGNAVKTINR